MLLADRLKLFRGLRGNHVVVAVKMERAFSTAIGGEQAHRSFFDWIIAVGNLRHSCRRRGGEFVALKFEACFAQSFFQQVCTAPVPPTRRIFGGNRDELCEQLRHLVLASLQPSEKGLAQGEVSGWARNHEVDARKLGRARQGPNWVRRGVRGHISNVGGWPVDRCQTLPQRRAKALPLLGPDPKS